MQTIRPAAAVPWRFNAHHWLQPPRASLRLPCASTPAIDFQLARMSRESDASVTYLGVDLGNDQGHALSHAESRRVVHHLASTYTRDRVMSNCAPVRSLAALCVTGIIAQLPCDVPVHQYGLGGPGRRSGSSRAFACAAAPPPALLTMAPALAAMGPSFLLMEPPALNKAMSTSLKLREGLR